MSTPATPTTPGPRTPRASGGTALPGVPPAERIVVCVDPELADLIGEFLANRRGDVQAIPAALAAGDFASIQTRGHNLKGVGAAYGFDFLTDLGAALEAAAARRDAGATRRCAESLAVYLARLEVRVADA